MLRVGLFLGLWAAAVFADVAVPREGKLVEGEFVLDVKRGKLQVGQKTRELSEFLLVERDDGTHVWSGSHADRMQGYLRLVVERRRPQLVKLAKNALSARSHQIARRVFDWAVKEGYKGSSARSLRKRIDKAEKKPRKAKQDKIADLMVRERKLRGMHPALLLERSKKEQGAPALKLLRATLDLQADYTPGLDLLETMAPKDFPLGSARAWLAWHLDMEGRGFEFLPADLVDLKRLQHHWRPDLFGVQSGDLRAFTSIRNTDVLNTRLLYAHATLKLLRGLFHTDTPVARSKDPLTIHLYANKQNFVDQRRYKGSATVPPFYRWDQGHFDLRDDVSRFLGNIEGVQAQYLNYVIIHEVTRHWLWSRNPCYSAKELMDAPAVAGYWVVAGFPAFLGEGDFDLETLAVNLGPTGTRALQLVADNKRRLFPWREFLFMDLTDVGRLEGKRVKLWLGDFYRMQAAATCHYLYNGAGGKHRKKLIQYLLHQYTGKQAKLSPLKAFGMSADDLGAAVVAYAERNRE